LRLPSRWNVIRSTVSVISRTLASAATESLDLNGTALTSGTRKIVYIIEVSA
jgi:hypothetical protein